MEVWETDKYTRSVARTIFTVDVFFNATSDQAANSTSSSPGSSTGNEDASDDEGNGGTNSITYVFKKPEIVIVNG